jgi:hypothetical protein
MFRKNEYTPSRSLLLGGVASCLLVASTANAEVVADFNDFTLGSPNGQSAGTGFDPNSTWGGSGTVEVVAGDLTSTNYSLTQTGTAQSFQGDYTLPRHSARDFEDEMTGRVWFSFLLNLPEDSSRGGIAFNTTSTNGTDFDYSVFLLGPETLRVTPGVQNANNVDASVSSESGETNLIVGYLDTDDDSMAVWFNPDLINQPNIFANTPDVQTPLVSGSEIESVSRVAAMSWGGDEIGGIIDHVRVSESYTEATGAVIPEPGSLALLAIGGIAMASRRRH